MDTIKKIAVSDIKRRKGRGKLAMLTCYDYSFARILDEAGIEVLLVGDSLANVVLGLSETRKISIVEMLNHTAAVAKGVVRALVVADMPYASYQRNPGRSVFYAKKFIAAGAAAVKVEWFQGPGSKSCVGVVRALIAAGIPVMGHIGLTPQTAHLLGGYKVQGKDLKSARAILSQALLLQRLGVFSIVLECIPWQLSRLITARLTVPTIGIGAGSYCDGQVLVLYDFLGLYGSRPTFARVYAPLARYIESAIKRFKRDIKEFHYPSSRESFAVKEGLYRRLKKY
ncbi:MAG: 3-methyl-2-oxobutanoate hydroxymethyltransferase [Candidatus Omnitrophota bacterium]